MKEVNNLDLNLDKLIDNDQFMNYLNEIINQPECQKKL